MKNCKTVLARFGLTTIMVMVVGIATEMSVAKNIHPQTAPMLMADYKAINYHSKIGTWIDSSDNRRNAKVPAGATAPTLAAKATADGSPAVSFNGKNQYMKIFKGIQPGHGYTVVAFAEPLGSNARVASAVVAGGPGSLEYRIQTMSDGRNKQVLLKTATMVFGASSSPISMRRFSMIAVATDNTGNGTFYLNGNPDDTFSGNGPFNQPVVFIGAAATGPGATPAEFFHGYVAELRIYSGVLSPRRIKALAASFKKIYAGHH